MKHRTDCPGRCGTWTDQHRVKWNLCRMTDIHLQRVKRQMEDNCERMDISHRKVYNNVGRELQRREP